MISFNNLECSIGRDEHYSSPFPFPPVQKYNLESQKEQFINMVIKFYKYCQRSNVSTNLPNYLRRYFYSCDFSKKNIVFLQEKDGNTVSKTEIKSISGVVLGDESSQLQIWTFSMAREEGLFSESYMVREHHPDVIKYLPFFLLDGNEYEVGEGPYLEGNIPVLTDKKWDDWKLKMKSSIQHYRERIYPIFQKGLVAASALFNHQNFSVLDIGGGDGELAFSLLESCPLIETYTLIDGNQVSVDLALERKNYGFIYPEEDRKRLQVKQGDITKMDLFNAIGEKPVDVIVLCGVIAYQVLSFQASQALLQRCKKLLKDKGVILIASHSPCYFNASDFQNMGWEVLNKSYQYPLDLNKNEYGLEPFYVLRGNCKTSSGPKQPVLIRI